MKRLTLVAVALLLMVSVAPALTIGRNFIGGSTPGNTSGGGTLSAIFNAAADWWEMAILDTHTVNIDFGWADLDFVGTNVLGLHSLTGQSGMPNRETSALIRFDNTGRDGDWFADSTPHENSEYQTFTESETDFGPLGFMNTGRKYTDPLGDAIARFDLLSVAKHEIGHALGLSSANTAFQAENGDLDIDIDMFLPFGGASLSTTQGAHLAASQTLMFPSSSRGVRTVQSAADILANAAISDFRDVNLDPKVPEAGSLVLLLAALGVVAVRRRKRAA